MCKEEKEAQLMVLAHLAVSPPNDALSKANVGWQWDRQHDIMVWLDFHWTLLLIRFKCWANYLSWAHCPICVKTVSVMLAPWNCLKYRGAEACKQFTKSWWGEASRNGSVIVFNGVSQAETLRLSRAEASVSLMALGGGSATVTLHPYNQTLKSPHLDCREKEGFSQIKILKSVQCIQIWAGQI